MDAEVKAKWIEALRSGNYAQGRGQLRDGNFFCCLGVLCDITPGVEWTTAQGPSSDRRARYGGSISTCYLPIPIAVRLEIGNFALDTLMQMNDDGESFSAIAQYIEENL